MPDYLPRRVGLLDTWTRNFAKNIAAAPEEYGLTSAETEEIQQAVTAHSAAFALTRTPTARFRGNFALQQKAKTEMLRVVRRYARLIKADPAVSRDRKMAAGLQLDQAPRELAPVPVSHPVLSILSAAPLRHVLRCSDMETDRIAKPRNAIGMQLFCHVGDKAPANPLDARFESFVTRQVHRVDFKSEQVGQTAFYFARWQNATGKTGPWSQTVRMTIAG